MMLIIDHTLTRNARLQVHLLQVYCNAADVMLRMYWVGECHLFRLFACRHGWIKSTTAWKPTPWRPCTGFCVGNGILFWQWYTTHLPALLGTTTVCSTVFTSRGSALVAYA